MEIVYLLVPLSTIFVLMIVVLLWWAVHTDQFESVEAEGRRVLDADDNGEPATPEG